MGPLTGPTQQAGIARPSIPRATAAPQDRTGVRRRNPRERPCINDPVEPAGLPRRPYPTWEKT